MQEINLLVAQIIAMNHAWKLAVERWSGESNLANSLRDRKSCLQVRLLRDYQNWCFLRLDLDHTEGEDLYSVRLMQPITLENGYERRDAEHMPVRLAQEFFTEDELSEIVK
ncbi:MAG: hypothetical protein ACJAZT_000529 [Gammaproteobacteria bacterium]|jgi:hypothetical protein